MIPRDLEHSRRRAPDRESVLIELYHVKIATVGELSRRTGVRPSRVHGILKGDGREYAHDLSLVAQGAAEPHPMFGAEAYRITLPGAHEVERFLN